MHRCIDACRWVGRVVVKDVQQTKAFSRAFAGLPGDGSVVTWCHLRVLVTAVCSLSS